MPNLLALLAVVALLLTIASAIGKAPLWVAVFLLAFVACVQLWGR
jgi:hypothetical protein